MEWRDVKDQIEEYNNKSTEEIQQIVKSGVDTEFWKWFRSRIALILLTTESALLSSEVTSLDSALKLGNLNAVYKQLNHLFRTPEFVLAYKQPPAQAKPPKSAKIGRA